MAELTPKQYEELEEAKLRVAVGYKTMKTRVNSDQEINSDGEKVNIPKSSVIEETEFGPNLAVIKELLDDRIGGPQDYI